jgi:GTPase KRas protein
VLEYDPTIENSFRKAIDVDNKSVMLDIIDTAGQEEYKPIRDQYLKRGQGFLLVYAIDSIDSFRAITPLYESILRAKDEDQFPMVLVGNKVDLEQNREVPTQEAKALAEKLKIPFFETSAKERINLVEAFAELVRQVDRYRESKKSGTTSTPTNEQTREKKKRKRLKIYWPKCEYV